MSRNKGEILTKVGDCEKKTAVARPCLTQDVLMRHLGPLTVTQQVLKVILKVSVCVGVTVCQVTRVVIVRELLQSTRKMYVNLRLQSLTSFLI